jgi:hypothetical protein
MYHGTKAPFNPRGIIALAAFVQYYCGKRSSDITDGFFVLIFRKSLIRPLALPLVGVTTPNSNP